MTHPAVAHVTASGGVRPGGLDPRWRITVNFHPDRLRSDGRTVVDGLDADGRWRTQFETGLTAGSATAYPGGDRDRWEQHLFGSAYTDAPASARPVYGGLDVAGHPDGACPRFGSCHLRLRRHVLARSTFCAGDSHLLPTAMGTADAFGAIAATLPSGWSSFPGSPGRPDVPGRVLDDYVEAQVHGGVDLTEDVEAVVVDPAFRATPVGRSLQRLAARRDLALTWSRGFVLDPDAVPVTFRGAHLPPLVRFVQAEHGRVDAASLGIAAAQMGRDPEAVQHVKHVWHAIVAFGAWGTGVHAP